MRRLLLSLAAILCLASAALAQNRPAGQAPPAAPAANTWRFAVSGDSRNCGDVIMPGIAAGVLRDQAEFYWHLGDFRAIYDFDEDILHQPEHLGKPLVISDYLSLAWPDFIDNQLAAFGSLPVFLALGNHEIVPPKTREEALPQFADWFNAPAIARQRIIDNPHDRRMKTYYHWIERGVAFYTLDNSTPDQFDSAQMGWFVRTLAQDSANPAVTTLVVGMHEALPDSIAADHSMNSFDAGTESGRHAYADLLRVQNEAHKRVYVLASHSHYFMDGIFNTEYLRAHGGVLPGWIVGTAGAVRYALPPKARDAHTAETNVYGYLLATVSPSGEIRFDYKRLAEKDLPAAITNRYKSAFVHWCFAKNSQAR